MLTTSDVFERELRKRIEEQIEEVKNVLAFGYIPNFDDYKYYNGIVTALRAVLEYCDEARKTADRTL
jgi:hypothetical protein